VEDLQKQGILTPELSTLPSTVLKDWGYALPAGNEQVITPGKVTTPPTTTGAGNLSGTYQGTYRNNATGQQGTLQAQLVQSGNNITGTMVIDGIEQGQVTGNISGNNVRLTAQISSYYGNYVAVFTGVFQQNTIQGNYTIQGANVGGSFSLNKVQ